MQKERKIEKIISSLYSKKEEKESNELTNKLIQSLLNFSMILALLSIAYYFSSIPTEGYYVFPLSNLGFSPFFGLIFFLIFIFVLYFLLPKKKA